MPIIYEKCKMATGNKLSFIQIEFLVKEFQPTFVKE